MVKFMNILVIESSPHKKGSSNLLAEHFIQGAEEARHKVTVFDAAGPISTLALAVMPVECPGHAARRMTWHIYPSGFGRNW